MKKLSILLITCILLSCSNKTEKKVKNKKILCDSIEIKKIKSSLGYRFEQLLHKEKHNNKDTLLIKSYKKLLGENNLFDLYIYDRIRTINNYKAGFPFIEGNYHLKNKKSYSTIPFDKIIIREDSCFLFKEKKGLNNHHLNIIYSSNKIIKYKFKLMINNRGYLFRFIKPKTLIIEDLLCLDCESLQFYKYKP